MKIPKLPFRVKIGLLIGWSMMFVTIVSSYSIYKVALDEGTRQLGQRLLAVALTGALNIDVEVHESLVDPAQMESAAYKNLKNYLIQIRDTNKDMRLRYVYTQRMTDTPGMWTYVVDAESPESEFFSPLGEVEDFTYDPDWQAPLEKPDADQKIEDYRRWGYLLSASTPLRDRNGKSVGVLSVDAEPDDVTLALLRLRRWGLGLLIVGLGLCLFLTYYVVGRVSDPIEKLIAATKRVAKGDFNAKVTITKREELSELASSFNKMIHGLQERELVKHQFERYVSHQVAKKILEKPAKKFWASERKKITVLFCDIRNFTAIAEELDPEHVVKQLNEFFSHMIDIVFKFDGTLDKFIGDAIMALYGAPLSSGRHEAQAVSTALAMQKRIRELNIKWKKQGMKEFKIGIGIHTGDVVIGNIGSVKRMEYTAIGDNVNMASRIEDLNKKYKSGILISEKTYQAVSDLFVAKPVATEVLRGRHTPIRIYEVLGPKKKSFSRQTRRLIRA